MNAIRVFCIPSTSRRAFASNRASLARISRLTYTRMYPTVLMQPDGSTVRIRYPEPRQVVVQPLDLSSLSESERRFRVAIRKGTQVREQAADADLIADEYDPRKYARLVAGRKKRNN